MPRPFLALAFAALLPFAANADDRTDDFFAAARRGDVKAVGELIDRGVDVNAKTAYGATALHFAADKGHIDVVKLLLKHKADPNVADTFYSATPLTWANMRSRTDVITELLAAGAKGEGGLLRPAAAQGKVDLVKAIIVHGKPTPEQLTAAWKATTNDEVIELLKKAGAKPPEKTAVEAADSLKPYAGTYRQKEIGELSVALDAGSLFVSSSGQRLYTLLRDKDDAFKVEGGASQYLFERKDGKVVGFTLKGAKFEDRKFDRVEPAKTVAKETTLPDTADPTDAVNKPMNWPQFRGPGATGIADGQFPPTNFDVPKGKNVRWKTPIPGLGHSCPVVWDNYVYLTTAISGDPKAGIKAGQYGNVESVDDNTVHRWLILCLDKKDGKIVWEKEACRGLPQVKRHLKSTHANPTVATDGTHVVACFGAEGLYCYDKDGKFLWKRDLGKLDSGWFYDPDYQWGFGSSPVIFEDRVIVQCDAGKNAFIAAYALKNGSTLWQTPREEVPSWGTPTVVVGPERTEIVTNATKFARGYDPATGKEFWRLGKHSEITVPTPFLGKGLIWFASGYSPVQPIYAVRPGATGDISLKEKETKSESIAWSKQKGGPYMPTPIIYGDYLYTCANSGLLTCYEAETGKQLYSERLGGAGGFTASPVAADGRLYFTGEESGVRVVKAGPKFELLAINPVGESCLATPAISDGLLLVRSENHLIALARAVK